MKYTTEFLLEEFERIERVVIETRSLREIKSEYIEAALLSKNSKLITRFQMLDGIKSYYQGKYNDAKEIFKQIEESKSLDDLTKHKIQYWLCGIDFYNGRKKEPFEKIQPLITYFSKHGISNYQYIALTIQSQIFLEIGFYDEAYLLQEQCASYYREQNLYKHYIAQQIQIANLFYQLEKFELAEERLKKVYDEFKELIEKENENFKTNYWRTFGDIYLKWGRAKECFQCFEHIIKFDIENIIPSLQCNFYNSYAQAFLLRDDKKSALKYSLLAYKIASKIHATASLIIYSQNIAYIYISENNLKDAEVYLKKGLAITKTSNFGILTACLHEAYAKFYQKQKKFELAQSHLEQHISILKSINTKETDLRIEAIRALNEIKEKEIKLKERETENELQRKELELTTMFLNQKNSLLNDLETFIRNLKKENMQKQKVFEVLSNKLKMSRLNNIENEAFKEKLDQTNQEFTRRLREQYPTVTKTESQVASLLAKSMTTKEISNILIMDTKSVEMHRYRLRQKLGLRREEDLSTRLNAI